MPVRGALFDAKSLMERVTWAVKMPSVKFAPESTLCVWGCTIVKAGVDLGLELASHGLPLLCVLLGLNAVVGG